MSPFETHGDVFSATLKKRYRHRCQNPAILPPFLRNNKHRHLPKPPLNIRLPGLSKEIFLPEDLKAFRLVQYRKRHSSIYRAIMTMPPKASIPFLAVAVLVRHGQGFVTPHQHNVRCPPIFAAATGEDVIKTAGDGALNSVEWFGSLVSRSASGDLERSNDVEEEERADIGGTGGSVYNKLSKTIDTDEGKETQVWAALANLEKDSKSSRCEK